MRDITLSRPAFYLYIPRATHVPLRALGACRQRQRNNLNFGFAATLNRFWSRWGWRRRRRCALEYTHAVPGLTAIWAGLFPRFTVQPTGREELAVIDAC